MSGIEEREKLAGGGWSMFDRSESDFWLEKDKRRV